MKFLRFCWLSLKCKYYGVCPLHGPAPEWTHGHCLDCVDAARNKKKEKEAIHKKWFAKKQAETFHAMQELLRED